MTNNHTATLGDEKGTASGPVHNIDPAAPVWLFPEQRAIWSDGYRAGRALAPTPPAPSGLVDVKLSKLIDDLVAAQHEVSCEACEGENGEDELKRLGDVRDAARHALDATLSGQQGGAVPAGDKRLPGLEFAVDIADHCHQRFLTLRHEQGVDGVTSFSSLDALQHRAEGAKKVLDEIQAERARLAAQPGKV